MTAIVLDLEWNGAHCPAIGAYFNEIIEIGAVKLDDHMRIVDEFQMTVRPTANKKLSHIVKDLTHITEAELSAAGTVQTSDEDAPAVSAAGRSSAG